MAVAVVAASAVVPTGWAGVDGGVGGPYPADGGEPVVFDAAMGDRDEFAQARVTGADPAYAFSARSSANRARSSPISARIRAPVRSARPGKLVMTAWSGCLRNSSVAACSSSSAPTQAASRIASRASVWRPIAFSTSSGWRSCGARSAQGCRRRARRCPACVRHGAMRWRCGPW